MLYTLDSMHSPNLAVGVPPPARRPLRVRHLKTPAEIAGILHFREEIDLSAHTVAGRSDFLAREKKVTSAVLLVRLNYMMK